MRARRTSAGRIPKRLLPKTLLGRKDKFEDKEEGILYLKPRRRSRRAPPVAAYLLRRQVTIRKAFRFFERCAELGPRVFERVSAVNYEKSVAFINRPGRLR